MDFDHVRGKKQYNVATAARGRGGIQRLRDEIAKCDVVCANCHRLRHKSERDTSFSEYESIARTKHTKLVDGKRIYVVTCQWPTTDGVCGAERIVGAYAHRVRFCVSHQRTYKSRRGRATNAARAAAIIATAKDVPCEDCGKRYQGCVLDFDHVRGTKRFNIAVAVSAQQMGMQRLRDEIAKCEVVCANCHRVRTQALIEASV